MINLFNGTGQYSYTGSAQTAFNNCCGCARHATWDQRRRRVDRQALDQFHASERSGDARGQRTISGRTISPAFVEDTWKASPKLTVNAGIRWDLFAIPQPQMPNTLTSLTTEYTSTINIPKAQFAPRVGLAYMLSPKTVVRTGWGMFYAKTTNSTYYATRVENRRDSARPSIARRPLPQAARR